MRILQVSETKQDLWVPRIEAFLSPISCRQDSSPDFKDGLEQLLIKEEHAAKSPKAQLKGPEAYQD